ncbi:MAG: TonB-dependent receptor domain-containing protein [Candidatus Neomarinimicrobiota bacterium]
MLWLLPQLLPAQTTGKIAGKITDAETGEPLYGANVLLEGTILGAATDASGDYYIINVAPGTYTLVTNMIGYDPVRVEGVRVSVNRTSEVDVRMNPTVLAGEEVTVIRERVAMKKDQTSTIKNVSADQMDILPVEDITAIIEMQAGIVQGHFRGGRNTEVSYLVDGMRVDEPYDGQYSAIEIEPETVQDLEVITGTFNAEYGQAMSGVVNQVTKEGGESIHGSASVAFANYATQHDDIFIGLEPDEFDRNQDYKLHLGGPILGRYLTFFLNYREERNKNHLNGIRRFNVDDFSSYVFTTWYTENTGDSAYVPMNRSHNRSFMAKLNSTIFEKLRIAFLYNWNNDIWHDYNHSFKYNPDGMGAPRRVSDLLTLTLNHMLTKSLFYELKASYLKTFNGWYVFEDPTDSGYVHDVYLDNTGPGFYTGGHQKDHNRRILEDRALKFDLTWQLHKNHSIKTGVHLIQHSLDVKNLQIRNLYYGTAEESKWYFDFEQFKIVFPYYEPVIMPDSSIYSDMYQVSPVEFAGYFQDKMEFDEMVINLGLRYDYFDPATVYPSERRNPANQLDLPPERMSTYPDADPQVQLSPRVGLSYQLGDKALLHFSYGHFFQMPPMYSQYQNHAFRIAPTDFETIMGNAQVKAERTITYEVGLWQEVIKGLGVEVALYYKDIYDLLSGIPISTYNQIIYGLYSNKDYGNTRGLEVKCDYITGDLSVFLNYTLQYTRGNADNPVQTFDRAGERVDPVNRLIPMSWDQRHTLNLTVGYNTDRYGATLTGYYNSGTPYTFIPIEESRLSRVNLYPNNDWQPAGTSVDLSAYYNIPLSGRFDAKLTLNVYNLTDRLNEVAVSGQTGRAYTAIIRPIDIAAHRSDFNTFEDVVHNPSMYAAPRLIKIGLGLTF